MERLTLSYVWKQKPTPVGLRRTWREAPGATAICRRQSAMAAERPANGTRNGSSPITPIGSCQSPGSTTSSIERRSATAGCTSSSRIASGRSAGRRARKHKGTNASVPAWVPTTAWAMTGAGSRSPTPSQPAGASANSPVVCSQPDHGHTVGQEPCPRRAAGGDARGQAHLLTGQSSSRIPDEAPIQTSLSLRFPSGLGRRMAVGVSRLRGVV